MNVIDALRQCIEAMKLVDFKDCGESEALWKQFNDAQANAERVLRDGEKQEPFGYFHELISKNSRPGMGKIWLGCESESVTRQSHIPGETGEEVFALYRHPAPSQQAAPRLPSTPEEVIEFIGPHFNSLGMQGPIADRRITLSVHDLLSAFRDWQDGEPPQQAVVVVPLDLSKLDTYSWEYGGMDRGCLASDKFSGDFVMLSDLKDLIATSMKPAAAPSGDMSALICDTRRWTRAMVTAWHLNIPHGLDKALAELRAAAITATKE